MIIKGPEHARLLVFSSFYFVPWHAVERRLLPDVSTLILNFSASKIMRTSYLFLKNIYSVGPQKATQNRLRLPQQIVRLKEVTMLKA